MFLPTHIIKTEAEGRRAGCCSFKSILEVVGFFGLHVTAQGYETCDDDKNQDADLENAKEIL